MLLLLLLLQAALAEADARGYPFFRLRLLKMARGWSRVRQPSAARPT
jgi:hypothetical protein